MKRWLRAMTAGVRELWKRARREHSTPPEVGFAVALGAFVAFTPFIGFHIWIALGLASVLRLNRLWAAVASHISPPPIFVAVSFLEIEAAHHLRTGAWAPIAAHEVMTHGRELFTDWLIGVPLVAGPIAACVGLGGYFAARRWQSVRPPSPGEALPPSSESPPSAPRAPTT